MRFDAAGEKKKKKLQKRRQQESMNIFQLNLSVSVFVVYGQLPQTAFFYPGKEQINGANKHFHCDKLSFFGNETPTLFTPWYL